VRVSLDLLRSFLAVHRSGSITVSRALREAAPGW
jgi:hypothetical protein